MEALLRQGRLQGFVYFDFILAICNATPVSSVGFQGLRVQLFLPGSIRQILLGLYTKRSRSIPIVLLVALNRQPYAINPRP